LLGRNRVARACIDLSDGLADGVRQVAAASELGAIVEGDAVPVVEGARRVFADQADGGLRAVLTGGEDYELLFAVPPKRRRALEAVRRLSRGVPFTRIGAMTADRALVLRQDGRADVLPAGFAHFG
jgi:thiamine-monophosphate kinase